VSPLGPSSIINRTVYASLYRGPGTRKEEKITYG
jgi:hypothetical protein